MKARSIQFVGVFALAFAALIVGCNSGGKPPSMKSADVQSLVLYDVDPRVVPNYLNLLPKVGSHPLKAEEINLMFANTTDESLHIWKGAYLGVAQCKDGTKYHLALSYYGGFVRVLETGQSLRFVGASGIEWERVKKSALEEVFFPARQRINQAAGR